MVLRFTTTRVALSRFTGTLRVACRLLFARWRSQFLPPPLAAPATSPARHSRTSSPASLRLRHVSSGGLEGCSRAFSVSCLHLGLFQREASGLSINEHECYVCTEQGAQLCRLLRRTNYTHPVGSAVYGFRTGMQL